MKYTLDLKKFISKSDLRPELTGVYFHDNKAVATDTFKLAMVESKTEKVKTPSLVRGALLKPGSTVEGHTITEEGGAVLTVPKEHRLDYELFPKYQAVLPDTTDDEWYTLTLDAAHLMACAELAKKHTTGGFPHMKVAINTKRSGKPIVMTTDTEESKLTMLLMPVNR